MKRGPPESPLQPPMLPWRNPAQRIELLNNDGTAKEAEMTFEKNSSLK
jgi:hypothetical protein